MPSLRGLRAAERLPLRLPATGTGHYLGLGLRRLMPKSTLIAERAVKPFVIGRKNWLFSNTPRGAEASCGIYSVVVSARESGLSPLRYVEWLLEELPLDGDLADPAVVRRFLPWSDGVPDRCRVPGAETERLRAVQEEPIADVDPGALREDE